MKLPRYSITFEDNLRTFYFISEGKKGIVEKVVHYDEIAVGVFNLALADRNPITSQWDDEVVTDNDDTEKILATVIDTVYIFTTANPTAYIYAKGSTHSRNRLYRRSITKYLEQALKDFIIWGELEDENTELFNPTTDYIGFLIQRKKELL
jgi:hypothetical protein